MQKQSTNKRGGARNFKKTDLSNVALLRLFENHLSEKGHLVAFQFGSYYNKPASNAVVGPELASMMGLIEKIVAVAPSADLKYIPMKDAFGKLLLKSKDLMGVFPNKDINAISSDLANSLMTVCNHARRLKEDIRWQQAIAKCNSHEIAQLKKIRGFFKNSQTDGDDEYGDDFEQYDDDFEDDDGGSFQPQVTKVAAISTPSPSTIPKLAVSANNKCVPSILF